MPVRFDKVWNFALCQCSKFLGSVPAYMRWIASSKKAITANLFYHKQLLLKMSEPFSREKRIELGAVLCSGFILSWVDGSHHCAWGEVEFHGTSLWVLQGLPSPTPFKGRNSRLFQKSTGIPCPLWPLSIQLPEVRSAPTLWAFQKGIKARVCWLTWGPEWGVLCWRWLMGQEEDLVFI